MTKTPKYSFYEVEKKGHVAWLFMNRPEKRNALGADFWDESPLVMKEMDTDDDVRVVILAGRGNTFCAGIDLFFLASELSEYMKPDAMGGKRFTMVKRVLYFQDAFTAFEACRKPVIAAIQGRCIGGGIDLVTACDIRLASAEALFSVREASMSVVPDGGTLQRLPKIVGEGYAKELAFTAKDIDASWAKEIHLVNGVFPDVEALYAGAETMAAEIAGQAPLAVMAAKEVIHYSREKTVGDGLDYVAQRSANILPSKDFFEAIAAFGEKRKPRFTGQ